jgi:CHAT domain-containing protein
MLRAQMARQALSPVDEARPLEERKLADRADQLEEELAKGSVAVRRRRDAPTLDDVVRRVAAAVAPGAVLVEIVEYRCFRFRAKRGEPRWGDLRYSALTLDPKAAVRVAPLGPADAIDIAVKVLLRAITQPPQAQGTEKLAQEAGRSLEGLVFRPIRPFLGESRRLVLSPDGQLNLVPFWALFDGREYLIDRFDLSYVSSGRDLLRRGAAKPSTSVAVLARPTFVKDSARLTYAKDGARGLEVVAVPPSSAAQARLAPGALRLRSPPPPLPGTEQEAKAIRRLIPRTKLLLGGEATKERFLGLQAPGIVHVATHGLFRPEVQKGGGRGLEVVGELLTPAAATGRSSDALLHSMLLWANSGRPVAGGDASAVVLDPSGLATALEVAGMNLWGTQLVVLSACETGRGEVDHLGQGVYGLRRAVMVAGAETLVTSLWKVDDEVTRDLMTSYYGKLLAGTGRGEALRQASLAVRKKHPEPQYWAPFITIGQAGPLSGIR